MSLKKSGCGAQSIPRDPPTYLGKATSEEESKSQPQRAKTKERLLEGFL